MTPLKLNDLSVEVALLQIRLGLVPTFYFDDRTHKAVMAFQKANRLKPDGVVGPLTQQVLSLKPAPKNITPNPLKPWLPIAQSQIGIKENTLPLFGSWSIPWKDNPRVVEYHQTTKWPASDDEVPWCSSFVNWVMKASGREGTNNSGAKSWLIWNHGDPVTTPEPGYIVIVREAAADQADPDDKGIKGYHVGFYISKTTSSVRILGGNQGPEREGSVKESNYLLSGKNAYVVKGYRRPKSGNTAIYLKLGNVKGNVTAEGYAGWMQLATLRFGADRRVSMEAGHLANREAGRPSVARIAITKLADNSVAALFKESLTGAAGREAEIVFVHTGNRLQEYLRYKLSDCLVSGCTLVANADQTPVEGLMLSYSGIEVSYRDRDASGKPGTPMRVSYNVKEARVV